MSPSRALLVPVGAALEVRDRVVGAIQPWTSRTSAERSSAACAATCAASSAAARSPATASLRELRKRRNTACRELRKRRDTAARVSCGCSAATARSARSRRTAARPGPDRPVPDGAGEGRQAAGGPRPEGAAGRRRSRQGTACSSSSRDFRLPRQPTKFLSATYDPLVHAGRKQQSNLSSLSRRAPVKRGPSVFWHGFPWAPPHRRSRDSGRAQRLSGGVPYARPSASYSRRKPSNRRL